jgi:ribosomal protein S18 acetylase RimI-like enzyme
VRIREADEGDLEALVGIFARALEHVIERYRPDQAHLLPIDGPARIPFLRHLQRTGLVVVAEDPGPVGFAAAVVRDGVWFLSQLWVLPDHHRGGMGSALLDEVLAFGRGASAFCTVSSPHPAAHLLYLRASMFPLWTQIDMGGGTDDLPEPPEGVRELTAADQPWVNDLDRDVRGMARPEDHGFWRGQDGAALALQRAGAPAGYVYVWPDGKVGPGAVREATDVSLAIHAALRAGPGRTIFPVPSTNWRALGELVRLGFAPVGATNTFMASRALADGTRYLPTGALG